MSTPRFRCRNWLALALVAAGLPAQAEDLASKSGRDLYVRYCAACHGEQGRGDGPVSAAFRVEVPDLTLIARRHAGTFPRDLVERIIDGRHTLAAHGTRIMPVWGEVLGQSMPGDPAAEATVRTVTVRLADYVWQLQRPVAQ